MRVYFGKKVLTRCAQCRYYWDLVDAGKAQAVKDKDYGECHFNPPPWPKVHQANWCGRGKPGA